MGFRHWIVDENAAVTLLKLLGVATAVGMLLFLLTMVWILFFASG